MFVTISFAFKQKRTKKKKERGREKTERNLCKLILQTTKSLQLEIVKPNEWDNLFFSAEFKNSIDTAKYWNAFVAITRRYFLKQTEAKTHWNRTESKRARVRTTDSANVLLCIATFQCSTCNSWRQTELNWIELSVTRERAVYRLLFFCCVYVYF